MKSKNTALIISIAFIILLAVLFFTRLIASNRPTSTTRPPAAYEKTADKGLAVPVGIYTNNGPTPSQTRMFQATGQDNKFSFEKIIVYQYDIIRINFFSKDKTYRIAIPALSINKEIKKGENSIMEFQAADLGTFDILCSTCPGSKPRASLIVLARMDHR